MEMHLKTDINHLFWFHLCCCCCYLLLSSYCLTSLASSSNWKQLFSRHFCQMNSKFPKSKNIYIISLSLGTLRNFQTSFKNIVSKYFQCFRNLSNWIFQKLVTVYWTMSSISKKRQKLLKEYLCWILDDGD